MKFIKLLLYKIFGLKTYLRIVSKIYILSVKAGFGKAKYPELFFLKSIIKPGFTCIDIGANMGYYSVFLSKYASENGKVFAVEPVPLFAQIWSKNVKGLKNIELFNCALGAEETNVEMGMPFINGVVHHGMTKIVTDQTSNYEEKFNVQMKNPDKLFGGIKKIDFIKIDVEGYESIVFENMTETLKKHMPLIQSELSGQENRQKVIELLKPLGYITHILKNGMLNIASDNDILNYNGDFYFKTK